MARVAVATNFHLRAAAFVTAVSLIAGSSYAGDRFSEDAFLVWLQQSPDRSAQFDKFKAFLKQNDVADVVPAYELLISSSSSAGCKFDAFEIAPESYWPHVAQTLKYIQGYVKPAVGDVKVDSGYRNPKLNKCSGGVPGSAHQVYYALDMSPVNIKLTRTDIIAKLCQVHAESGQANDVGIGFYTRTRFHVDTMRFRKWGADGHSATSPCKV